MHHIHPAPRGGTRVLSTLALAALVMLAAVLAACSDGSTEPAGGASTPDAESTPTGEATTTAGDGAQTVTDSAGTEVELEGPPERIISFSPGVTEILFAIGAGDRVVATDEFSDYPPEAQEVEKLTYYQPDPEATLALDPDLIVMAENQEQQVEQFRDLGLPVFLAREPESVEGVLESVRLFGEITGQAAEAEELASDMEQRIEDITSRLDDVEQGPLVFFELDPELFTAAPDSFVGGLLERLKARNVAEGTATAFPQLSSEAIIEANPDVIFLTDAVAGESAETVAARPGWDVLTAVQEDRVYPLDGDLVVRPGPRIVEGLEEMARDLYPERFE